MTREREREIDSAEKVKADLPLSPVTMQTSEIEQSPAATGHTLSNSNSKSNLL